MKGAGKTKHSWSTVTNKFDQLKWQGRLSIQISDKCDLWEGADRIDAKYGGVVLWNYNEIAITVLIQNTNYWKGENFREQGQGRVHNNLYTLVTGIPFDSSDVQVCSTGFAIMYDEVHSRWCIRLSSWWLNSNVHQRVHSHACDNDESRMANEGEAAVISDVVYWWIRNGPSATVVFEKVKSSWYSSRPISDDVTWRMPENHRWSSDTVLHHDVICDNCHMQPIKGVRYKCESCEDFDLCQECRATTRHNHRFVQITQTTVDQDAVVHTGIWCDNCSINPIKGVRYKCESCDDFDLCQDCFASTHHRHAFFRITQTTVDQDVVDQDVVDQDVVDQDVVVHTGIWCEGCHQNPIEGVRYKHLRFDFDLCSDCWEIRSRDYIESNWQRITEPSVDVDMVSRESLVHTGYWCNGCHQEPIEGARYKHRRQFNFDLCSKCWNDRNQTTSNWKIITEPMIVYSSDGYEADYTAPNELHYVINAHGSSNGNRLRNKKGLVLHVYTQRGGVLYTDCAQKIWDHLQFSRSDANWPNCSKTEWRELSHMEDLKLTSDAEEFFESGIHDLTTLKKPRMIESWDGFGYIYETSLSAAIEEIVSDALRNYGTYTKLNVHILACRSPGGDCSWSS